MITDRLDTESAFVCDQLETVQSRELTQEIDCNHTDPGSLLLRLAAGLEQRVGS